MNSPHAFSLDDEVLQFRVCQTLQQRWVKAAPNVAGYRVPQNRIDEVARTALDAMLTRPFRNSRFPDAVDYARQLRCVRHWVRRGRPIRVNVGYAPMKNLHAARCSRADWAEFFALAHLCAWHNKAQALYPPGLHIKIVFDDAAVGLANRPPRAQMDSYIRSVGQLIEALGYTSFIIGMGRHSSFAWLFHLFPFTFSRLHLLFWERNPAHQAIIERMNRYAQRNLVLPANIPTPEQERLCTKASHRYRVYWGAFMIALWIQRVTFFANSLVGMYLDGNQHHLRLKGALHLTTLGKGQVTQPWQGEGALRDNGYGELLPVVLTQQRTPVYKKMVSGLDLLTLEGFDQIEVCWLDTELSATSVTSIPGRQDEKLPQDPLA